MIDRIPAHIRAWLYSAPAGCVRVVFVRPDNLLKWIRIERRAV